MTTTQALRYERRRRKEMERRRRIQEAVRVAILVGLALLIFGWAGAMDCQAEQHELSFWESQGVIVHRW